MNKEIFHLWDCLTDIWMQICEDQLGLLCVYLSSYPPGRTFQVILEAVLKSKSGYVLGQEATQILLEPKIKQRGDDLWNAETENWTGQETR